MCVDALCGWVWSCCSKLGKCCAAARQQGSTCGCAFCPAGLYERLVAYGTPLLLRNKSIADTSPVAGAVQLVVLASDCVGRRGCVALCSELTPRPSADARLATLCGWQQVVLSWKLAGEWPLAPPSVQGPAGRDSLLGNGLQMQTTIWSCILLSMQTSTHATTNIGPVAVSARCAPDSK